VHGVPKLGLAQSRGAHKLVQSQERISKGTHAIKPTNNAEIEKV